MSNLEKPNGHDLGPAVVSAQAVAEQQQAEQQAKMDPLFEVIIPSALAGVAEPAYHFKMWGDGTSEGFEKLAASGNRQVQVINRFPLMVEVIVQPLREYLQDIDAQLDAIAPPGEATGTPT
jgi:hypothetical protein